MRIFPALLVTASLVFVLPAPLVLRALEPISSYYPTAETVLDGKLGFPPSPPVEWKPEADGFAADRLFHVPAAGIHPRVLFAPEDLPAIRERVRSGNGKLLLEVTRQRVANGIDRAGTWENRLYQLLLDGKGDEFARLFHDDKAPVPSPGSVLPVSAERQPAVSWGAYYNAFVTALEAKALLALLDDDRATGRKLAAATTGYAGYLAPRIDAVNAGPEKDSYWRGARKVLGDGEAFGLLYDWTQPWMDAAQAKTVRGVLAAATANHYSLGMDLPPHWRNWNFIGMSSHFLTLSLCIEGEEGYDPRTVARMAEVYRDFLSYGLDDKGYARESVGYATGGLSNMMPGLVALANRGDNLFIHPHFRRMLDHWLLWRMEPQGGQWVSDGDLGTFPPNPVLLTPCKYLFPDDAQLDYVFQNLPSVRVGKPEWDFLNMLFPGEPRRGPDGKPVDYHDGADFQLPLTDHDATRGDLSARSDWTADAAMFRFDARDDTIGASHDHPDRGRFTFSAMGRAWALPSYRESEGKFQNCVTIDGRGAAFFPPPARWVGEADAPWATFGAVDVKYCWDWMWVKSPMTATDGELRAARLTDYLEPARRLQGRFPREQWQRDPLPSVAAYYEGFLKQNPLMWGEDTWVPRAPYFPVRRAFRTAGLVRGERPYALIVDDIQKDDQERLYEWNMNVPMDVDVVRTDDADLVLGDVFSPRQHDAALTDPSRLREIGRLEPKPGTPLLLMRTLQINQPAIPTYSPTTPALETFEYLKTDDTHQFFRRQSGLGKRVVLRSRSVAPDFKVLLFPMRQGDPLPVTTWNADRTQLRIEWKGQQDQCIFVKSDDGRTRVKIERDNQTPVELR